MVSNHRHFVGTATHIVAENANFVVGANRMCFFLINFEPANVCPLTLRLYSLRRSPYRFLNTKDGPHVTANKQCYRSVFRTIQIFPTVCLESIRQPICMAQFTIELKYRFIDCMLSHKRVIEKAFFVQVSLFAQKVATLS